MKGFAIYETSFGFFGIGYDDDAVTYIKKIDDLPSDMGMKTAFSDTIFAQLEEYFAGKRKCFDFDCCPEGTDFQRRVWSQLRQIPYGETRTYKDIAIAIGNSKACRAVGMANNRNPIMIVVPCHRVIGSNGDLVGYEAGIETKKALLELENRHK